jgi:hypothetical protein
MRTHVSVFHSAIVRSLLLVPYQRERKKVRGSTQPALLITPILEYLEGIGCKVICDAFSLIGERVWSYLRKLFFIYCKNL